MSDLRPRSVKDMPTGYQEVGFLHLTGKREFLFLNMLGVLFLVLSAPLFFGWLVFYQGVMGAPFVLETLPQTIGPLAAIGIIILMILLHELAHGLMINFWGHQTRYGIKPLKGVVYATADGALFWRNQYVAVALAPLVSLSLLVVMVSLFVSAEVALWLLLAGVLNASGAAGDVWMTVVAFRYPAYALMQDEEDGMRIFLPVSYKIEKRVG